MPTSSGIAMILMKSSLIPVTAMMPKRLANDAASGRNESSVRRRFLKSIRRITNTAIRAAIIARTPSRSVTRINSSAARIIPVASGVTEATCDVKTLR